MKLAIFTLGTRGDVQPYVALAKRAIQKGHQAVICTGKSFQGFIEGHGIEFFETESDLMAMLQTEEGKFVFNNATKHPLRAKKYLDTVVNPAYRKSLDQFYDCAQSADIILYHPKVFGAVDIALSLDIPCLSVPLVPMIYPIDEFPNLAISPTKNLGKFLNKLTYKVMNKAESSSISQVNDFRKKTLGLPKRKSGQYLFHANGKDIPILYPISQTLFPDVSSWNNRVTLSGFFFLDSQDTQLSQEISDFIKDGQRPLVVSFSSMPLKNPEKFTTILKEAILQTNNRAIILVGNSGLNFGNHPDILTIPSAPHNLLFPLAKGILHHGGVGTMASALVSGNPQIIMPFAVDQPFWAHRLNKLHYALAPITESTITTELLVKRFQELENPVVQQKAKEIQTLLAQESGVDIALEYILEICHQFKQDKK